jgi:hypothetical protein
MVTAPDTAHVTTNVTGPTTPPAARTRSRTFIWISQPRRRSIPRTVDADKSVRSIADDTTASAKAVIRTPRAQARELTDTRCMVCIRARRPNRVKVAPGRARFCTLTRARCMDARLASALRGANIFLLATRHDPSAGAGVTARLWVTTVKRDACATRLRGLP